MRPVWESEWDCFIAYPGPQFALAQQLAHLLEARLRVFLDRTSLRPGDNWPAAIGAALDGARIIVVIVAPETEQAFYQHEEIARAIARARAPGSGRIVVPVLVQGMTHNDVRIPYGLHTTNGFIIRGQEDLHDAADAIAELAAETAANAAFDASKQAESRKIAPRIKQYLSQLHIQIDQLTKEQYRVIQQLRYMCRLRISGCAGSGKTLVAAEKATRLARAGQHVLFLCHNPFLAEHVHSLTAGTGVQVKHFTQWVQELTGVCPIRDSIPWTHFHEPEQASLDQAFEVLTRSQGGFDAIIVDEGQDFRDEWWSVVEAGLSNPATGLLYIFHDNNQSLLPKRGKYPILTPPVDLSRNCRNAGRVFALMRCFDNSAPEPELALRARGHVLLRTYEPGAETLAIEPILHLLDAEELLEDTAVLLATDETLQDSPLAGFEVGIPVHAPWQAAVLREFNKILHLYPSNGVTQPPGGKRWVEAELMQLSQAPCPTEDDVELVRRVARGFSVSPETRTQITANPPYRFGFRWQLIDGAPGLKRQPTLRRQNRGQVLSAEKIMHFERPDWARGLPQPKTVVLQPFYLPRTPGQIPLYRVSDFKGLEAQAVVLVLRGRFTNQREATYVGVSRARVLLCVLSDQPGMSAFPRNFVWDT